MTAQGVPQVALDRASAAADKAGVTLCWVRSALVEVVDIAEGFDLVSAE